jgi:hypothetical protein
LGFSTVPPHLTGQVPIASLRDLIGICRALYVAWQAQGMGPVELDELAQVGRDLRAALELARRTKPDTVGHRAAWSRADEATRRLGHLVSALEPLRPTIEAASRRVCAGTGSRELDEREQKKRHARLRG